MSNADQVAKTRVLLIEDSDTDALLIQAHLRKAGLPVAIRREDRLSTGLRQIDLGNVDVVLLDLNLPDSSGLDTFRAIHNRAVQTPIIVLSGQDDIDVAVAAVSQGAQDYLTKSEANRSTLARSVRYAIERFRRQQIEQELTAAGEIQRRLFPQQAPMVPGFDIYGRCEPAVSAGGDYFDFFPMCDGGLGIVVADVSGHGLGPSLIMSETRAILRTLAISFSNVGDILTRANQVLCDDLHDNIFVALILVHLNPKTREVRFASAGHPALLLDQSGRIQQRLQSKDPPLGVIADRQFSTEVDVHLAAGDALLLYTDGIIETIDEEDRQFGEKMMVETVASMQSRSSRAAVDELFKRVHDYASDTGHRDDQTVVVVTANRESP
ncbi:MAG: SpoIIE family protein phosphatase [Pirellulaceae bacterium]|nr:SpoIIE family protein phosphatase [Pirellulaceae bacterium]